MATLLTSLPAQAFPSEIDLLEVQSSAPVRIVLRLGALVLLDTTLHPDPSSRIVLRDLSSLLTSSLHSSPSSFSIQLDGQLVGALLLHPCRFDPGVGADVFLRSRFLLASPFKFTHPGASERISWRAPEGGLPLDATAYWQDPSASRLLRTTHRPRLATDASSLTTADVSPSTFPAPRPSARLAAVLLSVGGLRQLFRLFPLSAAPRGVLSVRFVNGFGVWESFHFFGGVRRTQDPTFTTARADGRLRGLHVEPRETLEAHTAPLSPSELLTLSDLLTSPDIRTGADQRLVIVGSSVRHHSQSDAIQTATVTFRSERDLPRLSVSGEARTFDSTFDDTFE